MKKSVKFQFNHTLPIKRFVYKTSESVTNPLNWKENHKVYWGIDPTGNSLHIGHLLNIQLLLELLDLGWEVVVLLGNFTACIGDPTDKKATRSVLDNQSVDNNKDKLYNYIKNIFDKHSKSNKVSYVYNGDWLNQLNIHELLQSTYHFSVSHLISCDTFKQRLDSNTHLSLSELLYTVLQAVDFKYLYEKQGVNIQLGGRDQWGNISNGVSFLKKQVSQEDKSKIFGIVTDLLELDGQKVGKTTGHNLNINLKPLQLFNNIYQLNDQLIEQLLYLFLYKQAQDNHHANRLLVIQHVFQMVDYNFNEVLNVFNSIQQGKHQEAERTYSESKKLSTIIMECLSISKAESKRYIKNGITLNNEKLIQDQEVHQGLHYIYFSKKQLPIIIQIL